MAAPWWRTRWHETGKLPGVERNKFKLFAAYHREQRGIAARAVEKWAWWWQDSAQALLSSWCLAAESLRVRVRAIDGSIHWLVFRRWTMMARRETLYRWTMKKV